MIVDQGPLVNVREHYRVGHGATAMGEEQAAIPGSERQERRDARENRGVLLAGGKRLFAERGVAATSMKEIADAAGVGKGTLYRHFAHKGELCHAVLREDVAAFKER